MKWSLLAVAPFKPLGVRQGDVLTVDVVPGRGTLPVNGADPRPLSFPDLSRGIEARALTPLTTKEQEFWLAQADSRALRRAHLRLVT